MILSDMMLPLGSHVAVNARVSYVFHCISSDVHMIAGLSFLRGRAQSKQRVYFVVNLTILADVCETVTLYLPVGLADHYLMCLANYHKLTRAHLDVPRCQRASVGYPAM